MFVNQSTYETRHTLADDAQGEVLDALIEAATDAWSREVAARDLVVIVGPGARIEKRDTNGDETYTLVVAGLVQPMETI